MDNGEKKEILVSVIMSVYSEPQIYLKQSIESILNQTHKNLEFIIIVDKPDNKETILFINQYKEKDDRIKLIINDSNIGLVKSLNKGLSISKAEYVVRMDADDIAYEDRIKKQLIFMINNGIDILGGGVEIIDKNGIIKNNFTSNITGVDNVKKILALSNIIPHPTWMVRKDVYLKLKGYREIFTCEDYDFLLRAVKQGYKIDNLNECILKYRYLEQSISRSNALTQFLTMKNLQKIYRNKTEYVDVKIKNITKEKELSFMRANKKILRASDSFNQRNVAKSIFYMAQAIILSPYSFIKIKDILYIKLKYGR